MKKLIQVVRSAQTGGVENHVLGLIKNAHKYGYKPVLVSLTDTLVAEPFRELGIDIHCLRDEMRGSARSMANIIDLARLLRNIKPDIIHLHGARPLFVGSLASRLWGFSNLVSTLHGSYKLMAVDKNTSKIDPILLIASKIIHLSGFLFSKKVIVDANALIEEVRETCSFMPFLYRNIERKIVTIYPCIDFSHANPGSNRDTMRAMMKVGLDEVLVGCIGRIDEPMKGIRILLDAVHLLNKDGVCFYTIVVGEGYSRKDLERYAMDIGISERVRFLGFWEDLQDIYNMIDIFVLPSFSEGFPQVVLEAMENGLPVIATDVGGVSEAVIHGINGLIVPPRDARALADALKTLVNNKNMRGKMGDAAREISRSRFSYKVMLDRIFSIYDEVCSSS